MALGDTATVTVHSPVWTKYSDAIHAFDSVLEHAKAVSASLVGMATPSANASYGEQIFVSMVAQCITLRRLAPDPTRQVPNELWDLPSMCAIARCAIEAHDSFLYVASEEVAPAERNFRVSLWELHDKTRRLKMLDSIGAKNQEVETIRRDCLLLQDKVTGHAAFQAMSRDVKRKISDGDPPAFHLSQRKRCEAYGVNFDYYNAVTMQLSQYVHTLPFALHQLFAFRAGSDESLPLMTLPMQYVLPFLGRVAAEMRTSFPSRTPAPLERTLRVMAVWDAVYRRGVKGVA